MANVQLENGYTQIANELLEELVKFNFPSASPLKIMLFSIRKCYGYKKKCDCISYTQFEKGTNLSRPTIAHWLNWLVKSLLLVKGVKLSKNGYYYTINKDYHKWKQVVKPLELVKARAFTSKTPLTVTSKTPLTHKRKKEIQKKDTPKISKRLVDSLVELADLKERPDGDYQLNNLFPAKTLAKNIKQEISPDKDMSDDEILSYFERLYEKMDQFHRDNATNITYIVKNWNKIIKTLK